MTYTEIEVVGLDGTTQTHIIIDLGNAEYKSFPADENNPEYIAFLASQEEDN